MSYLTELQERDKAMTPRQGYYNEGDYLWECLVCGSIVEEGTNFCHHCGQRLAKED